MDYERFTFSGEIPFENDNQICLPVSYGSGKLFYSFPKGQTQKITLRALEKDGNIYLLDYMPYPLPEGEYNAGFLDFHKEVVRIEKEVNEHIISTAKIPDDVMSEAKRESEGFIYRLNNNRSDSKPHRYLTLKAIKDLNSPAKVPVEAAVEVFLERAGVRGLAETYKSANKFSNDFRLNVALYKLYSEAIEELGMSEKEQMIADALYYKKDVTVKFDIDGKRATGHYTVEQVMAAYKDGFPAPAPKGLSWQNIVEIYTGKKELCIFREQITEEKEMEGR